MWKISIMIAAKTQFSPATGHRHCSCNDARWCKAMDSQLASLYKTFLIKSSICKDSEASWKVKVETVSLGIDQWWMIDLRRIQHLWHQELPHQQDVVTIETKRKLKLAWIRTKPWILRNLLSTACYLTIKLKKVSHQVSKFKTSRFNRLTTRSIIAIWMQIQKIEWGKCCPLYSKLISVLFIILGKNERLPRHW